MRSILCLLSALVIFSSTAKAEILTFAADDWCPYNCNADAPQKGFIVDFLVEIFHPHGIGVKYVNSPWTRAVADIKKGNVDAIIGTSPREVPNAYFPKEEAGYYAPMYVTRKGSKWRYEGYKSLEKITLGAVASYHYGGIQKYIDEHKKGKYVVFVRGDDVTDRLVTLIVKKGIDVFLEDPSVVLFSAKKLGLLDEISFIQNPDKSSDSKIFIGFNPHNIKSKKYIRIFSEGMKRLRRTGRLNEILAKYGLKDWKSKLPK